MDQNATGSIVKLDLRSHMTKTLKGLLSRQESASNTIKERKFFKRNSTSVLSGQDDILNLKSLPTEDVSKVLKIVTKPPLVPAINDVKSPLKTYTRRKFSEKSEVVESFGLPDEPIIPHETSILNNLNNDPLDVLLSSSSDVNINSDDFNTHCSYEFGNASVLFNSIDITTKSNNLKYDESDSIHLFSLPGVCNTDISSKFEKNNTPVLNRNPSNKELVKPVAKKSLNSKITEDKIEVGSHTKTIKTLKTDTLLSSRRRSSRLKLDQNTSLKDNKNINFGDINIKSTIKLRSRSLEHNTSRINNVRDSKRNILNCSPKISGFLDIEKKSTRIKTSNINKTIDNYITENFESNEILEVSLNEASQKITTRNKNNSKIVIKDNLVANNNSKKKNVSKTNDPQVISECNTTTLKDEKAIETFKEIKEICDNSESFGKGNSKKTLEPKSDSVNDKVTIVVDIKLNASAKKKTPKQKNLSKDVIGSENKQLLLKNEDNKLNLTETSVIVEQMVELKNLARKKSVRKIMMSDRNVNKEKLQACEIAITSTDNEETNNSLNKSQTLITDTSKLTAMSEEELDNLDISENCNENKPLEPTSNLVNDAKSLKKVTIIVDNKSVEKKTSKRKNCSKNEIGNDNEQLIKNEVKNLLNLTETVVNVTQTVEPKNIAKKATSEKEMYDKLENFEKSKENKSKCDSVNDAKKGNKLVNNELNESIKEKTPKRKNCSKDEIGNENKQFLKNQDKKLLDLNETTVNVAQMVDLKNNTRKKLIQNIIKSHNNMNEKKLQTCEISDEEVHDKLDNSENFKKNYENKTLEEKRDSVNDDKKPEKGKEDNELNNSFNKKTPKRKTCSKDEIENENKQLLKNKDQKLLNLTETTVNAAQIVDLKNSTNKKSVQKIIKSDKNLNEKKLQTYEITIISTGTEESNNSLKESQTFLKEKKKILNKEQKIDKKNSEQNNETNEHKQASPPIRKTRSSLRISEHFIEEVTKSIPPINSVTDTAPLLADLHTLKSGVAEAKLLSPEKRITRKSNHNSSYATVDPKPRNVSPSKLKQISQTIENTQESPKRITRQSKSSIQTIIDPIQKNILSDTQIKVSEDIIEPVTNSNNTDDSELQNSQSISNASLNIINNTLQDALNSDSPLDDTCILKHVVVEDNTECDDIPLISTNCQTGEITQQSFSKRKLRSSNTLGADKVITENIINIDHNQSDTSVNCFNRSKNNATPSAMVLLEQATNADLLKCANVIEINGLKNINKNKANIDDHKEKIESKNINNADSNQKENEEIVPEKAILKEAHGTELDTTATIIVKKLTKSKNEDVLELKSEKNLKKSSKISNIIKSAKSNHEIVDTQLQSKLNATDNVGKDLNKMNVGNITSTLDTKSVNHNNVFQNSNETVKKSENLSKEKTETTMNLYDNLKLKRRRSSVKNYFSKCTSNYDNLTDTEMPENCVNNSDLTLQQGIVKNLKKTPQKMKKQIKSTDELVNLQSNDSNEVNKQSIAKPLLNGSLSEPDEMDNNENTPISNCYNNKLRESLKRNVKTSHQQTKNSLNKLQDASIDLDKSLEKLSKNSEIKINLDESLTEIKWSNKNKELKQVNQEVLLEEGNCLELTAYFNKSSSSNVCHSHSKNLRSKSRGVHLQEVMQDSLIESEDESQENNISNNENELINHNSKEIITNSSDTLSLSEELCENFLFTSEKTTSKEDLMKSPNIDGKSSKKTQVLSKKNNTKDLLNNIENNEVNPLIECTTSPIVNSNSSKKTSALGKEVDDDLESLNLKLRLALYNNENNVETDVCSPNKDTISETSESITSNKNASPIGSTKTSTKHLLGKEKVIENNTKQSLSNSTAKDLDNVNLKLRLAYFDKEKKLDDDVYPPIENTIIESSHSIPTATASNHTTDKHHRRSIRKMIVEKETIITEKDVKTDIKMEKDNNLNETISGEVPNNFEINKSKIKVEVISPKSEKVSPRKSSRPRKLNDPEKYLSPLSSLIRKPDSKFTNEQESIILKKKSPLKKPKMTDLLEVGTLAWAKVGNHPYWPCLIADSPETNTHFKYYQIKSSLRAYYHVKFFGDKGRRSWVLAHFLMEFKGKNDIKILRQQENPPTDLYLVKETKLKKWKFAVKEAQSLLNKSLEEKFDFFFKRFASKRERKARESLNLTNINKINNKKPKKRQRSTSMSCKDIQPPKKQLKKEINLVTDEPLEVVDKPVIQDELINQDEQQKLIAENYNEQQKLMKAEILEKSIEDLPRLRVKTRNTIIPDSDTDSKFSDNSSISASLKSQLDLFKRNNLFRGVSKDRVCQICFQPDNVIRCKSKCNGLFHFDCVDKLIREQEKLIINVNNDNTQSDVNLENTQNMNVEIISIKSRRDNVLPQLTLSPTVKKLSLSEQIDYKMKEIMNTVDKKQYGESTDWSSEDTGDDEINSKPTYSEQSVLPKPITPKKSYKKKNLIKHVTADDVSFFTNNDLDNSKNNENTFEGLPKVLNINNFKCGFCVSDIEPACLICHELTKRGSNIRQICSYQKCGRYYHPQCLKLWPQTQWSIISTTKHKDSDEKLDTFVCPTHVCHTCSSDDPRANSRCSSEKLVKCLNCPATYHSSNLCVPAGTEIISSNQIICPRHCGEDDFGRRLNRHHTINTTWCFICAKGGDLICCETCPTSVHAYCLPVSLTDDNTFICEDCESGRLPLYDEIVWVKLGSYRWWPALILFPNDVPENIMNLKHCLGEFVVKFFGTLDHYWVAKTRVFLYQEGDQGHTYNAKKKIDSAFSKAIQEAAAAYTLKQEFKALKELEKNNSLKPPPYIKIKFNRPVGNVRQIDYNISNTTACECDPNKPHPCGPDSDCINRLLLTECNPEVCPAGERCKNQCFEKREYPPLIPYRTQGRGWGLKSLAPIKKGQFVIEYVGEMIDEHEYQRRILKMHEQKDENYYFLTIDKDRMIDAGPKGNVARFMNHSCQPNCETQKWTVNGDTRVGLFATEEIPAEEELTFNYNLECVGEDKKICRCGAPKCSGFIGVKVKTDESQKKSKKTYKKTKIPTVESVDLVENECFVCGKLGIVGACNNKICLKYYHLECVNLETWPEGGKWVCPWHNCNVCTKRTIRCCVKCINSYCPSHSEACIRYDNLLGFVCYDHDPTKQTTELLIETLTPQNSDIITDESAVTSTTSDDDFYPPSGRKSAKRKSSKKIKNYIRSLDNNEDDINFNISITSTPLKNQTITSEKNVEESFVSSASSENTNIIKRKRGRPRLEESNKKIKLPNSKSKHTASISIPIAVGRPRISKSITLTSYFNSDLELPNSIKKTHLRRDHSF